MRQITIKELMNGVDLTLLAGEGGLDNIINEIEIRFPWLEFAGILNYFEANKINLVSSKEATYLKEIGEELAKERVEVLLQQKPSGFVFSLNVNVPQYFIELGNKYNVPILKSS